MALFHSKIETDAREWICRPVLSFEEKGFHA